MKIKKYTGHLSSGVTIDHATPAGAVLHWPGLHWAATEDRLEINRAEILQTTLGKELHISIRMALMPFTETMSFAERNPVEIFLTAETDSPVLAYYHFKDWWTRPAFVDSFDQIPEETTLLFYQSQGAYHFLVALPGKIFRSHFCGGQEDTNTIRLVLSADASGYTCLEETAMIAVTDPDPYRCMEKGMQYAAKLYGIPLREGRAYPELFEKIGWCSWDAFYKEVSETGMTDKAEEIRDKKLPFGWMLIDDGWQDYENDRMKSYGTDKSKFPDGLKSCVEKIREICGIEDVGVWHAFSGYWCGIDPEGPLARNHPDFFISSRQGKLLPKPTATAAEDFFSTWYQYLQTQGISFVKVDSQGSTRQHYRSNTPIGQTARALHTGLDMAAEKYMQGRLINCMGMPMENVLQRPISGLSRNSDDFFPLEEASFKEHLLENAYNCLWHNVIYYGDWDMFWSSHPAAQKHALLRALSGGPIYVSDRVCDTRREVLMPLCYEDGTILRADQGALPTSDCLLQNPAKCGYLKLQNICHGTAYLAVYSYREEPVQVPISLRDLTMPAAKNFYNEDGQTTYAVFAPMQGTGFTGDAELFWTCALTGEGFDFYQVAPVKDGLAVFGRKDKYLSSHAVTSRRETPAGTSIDIYESGPILIYSEKPVHCFMEGQEVPVEALDPDGFFQVRLPVKKESCQLLFAKS